MTSDTSHHTQTLQPEPQGTLWQRAVAWASGLDRRTLSWGGLALAAITMLAVNVIGSPGLRHVCAPI
jgi:hypothetical protein